MKTFANPNDPAETEWLYDYPTGLLTNKVYDDGNGTSYTYYPNGKLYTRTWARGVTSTNLYTGCGELLQVDYSDDTVSKTYTYTRLGQIGTVADGGCSVARIYDVCFSLNLAYETIIDFSNFKFTSTYYNYDENGRSMGYSVGDTYYGSPLKSDLYDFDEFGRPATLRSIVGTETNTFNYNYLYGSAMVSSITNNLGFGISKYYEDNRNLIVGVSNYFDEDCISSFIYQNDALGRLTERLDFDENLLVKTNSFSYNNYSELAGATMNTNNYNFTFDDIGNRYNKELNGLTESFDSNELNQYDTWEVGEDTTFMNYDLDGNMIANGTWSYSWNAENRMVAATNTADGTYVTYKYDYQGRMVKKVVGAEITLFCWQGNNIIAELTTNNSQLTTNLYTWANGETLTASLAGETVFYCHDANKNITDLVDDSGDLVAHYEYSPFGVITTDPTGSLYADNPFRFSNEYFDDTTGLIEYKYRKYNPDLGKFLSRDPIEEQGGRNLYAICGNDLINYWDEWGLNDNTEWLPPGLHPFFSSEEAAYNVNDYLEIAVFCVRPATKKEELMARLAASGEFMSGGFLSIASRSGLYGTKKIEEIKPERLKVNCNCGRLKVVVIPRLGIPKEIRERTKAPLSRIQLPPGAQIAVDSLWGAGNITTGTKNDTYPHIAYNNAKFNVGLFMAHKYKDIEGWMPVEKKKILRTWNTRYVAQLNQINYLPYYNKHDKLSTGDEVSIQIGSKGITPKANYILEIQ
ncbi:MAG: RHS repeat-associated core domain-containing protein [Kiritimatiellae bacterium]|nr:RHS repeat-associated core domain-containing protein [Kiritimatiellia bacterium]